MNNKNNNNNNGGEFDGASALKDAGVSEDVISDFLKSRKQFSKTAFNYLVSQSRQAGLTVSQAVEMVVGNGWKGFQARYVHGKSQPRTTQSLSEINPATMLPPPVEIDAQQLAKNRQKIAQLRNFLGGAR